MKVLMYGWEFPPHISGGLGIACHGITKALSALGVELEFVLPKLQQGRAIDVPMRVIDAREYQKHSRTERVHQDVTSSQHHRLFHIHTIESALKPYIGEQAYFDYLQAMSLDEGHSETRSYFVQMQRRFGQSLISEVYRYAASAAAIAASVQHDLIHVHDWLSIPAGLEAKRISGKPLIVHIHSLEWDRAGDGMNWDIYEIEKSGMLAADRVIAVSHYTKNIIIQRYQIPADKIDVVHNAVSKDQSRIRKQEKGKMKEAVVLFLGRVTFQKGPDYFLEAAAKVLALRQDVRFVIAGSGDMMLPLIERTAQLKLGNRVHFTGFLDRDRVEEIYSLSDVYIMPSVSEPFGISSLEAALYDVPVIISKQSGVSEVLRHSLRVDFWDTQELANKILALLDRPLLRLELQVQAARELEHIQWEAAGLHVKASYRRVLY